MAVEPHLVVLGLDFRTAPLALRECLAFTPGAAAQVLRGARAIPGICEAAILSTCNRTEFYLVVTDAAAPRRWLDRVHAGHLSTPARDPWSSLRVQSQGAAVRHLFRVACGLSSALLGDVHVAGQTRQAFALAGEIGCAGPYLMQLARHIAHVVRRARTETAIGHGAASVGSAVVAIVRGRPWPQPGRPAVLIVGAGTIARDVSRHLAKAGVGARTWINRTAGRACELADEYGGRAADWARLADEIAAADVVIVATGAPTPVIAAAQVSSTPDERRGPALIIDLGVPRNVAAGVAVPVITIDDVQARRDEALAARQAAVPAVETIVEEEVAAWAAWCAARPTEQVIKRLFVEEHRRRAELVAALVDRTAGAGPHEVDRLVRQFVGPLLHEHAAALRRTSRAPAPVAAQTGRGARVSEESV
jgi:glutamyl-tRNA reductase